MSIEKNEKVTIKRGKLAGQSGEIEAGPDAQDQYAVKLDSGELIVQKASNLRAPEELTVTASQLGMALAQARQETVLNEGIEARDLADALESIVPGISAKLGF